MQKPSEFGDWGEHLKQTYSKPPSALLAKALTYVHTSSGKALDLGGGALNDAQFLLAKGWEVVVVDSEPNVVEIAKEVNSKQLSVHTSTFDAYTFLTETYDLVNAMYSLSFNPPETFSDMMNRMKASLTKGGIFSGNVFGVRDDWKDNPSMTFFDKSQAEKLFEDMEIIEFQEVERDNVLANGTPKHWHVFMVIARRI